ncbi:MAG TPA: D-serine ammonia-lyase, partial [Rhizomicrobium sp.]
MIAALEIAPESAIAALQRGGPAVWRRPAPARDLITLADVDEARARFQRFEPILRQLFPQADWDGRVRSQLLDYPQAGDSPALLVKADHDLPVTGSIKARGGVHELLCQVERIARTEGIALDGDPAVLIGAEARSRFARHTLIVASTGNLGFSIGLLARAFGLGAEIHMSRDAKTWKKERLRVLGARVVEHDCDFSEAVERARRAAATKGPEAYFVDDESSRELMLGYAVAAYELAEQLAARGIAIGAGRPLFVYLPCGVGGAPGG